MFIFIYLFIYFYLFIFIFFIHLIFFFLKNSLSRNNNNHTHRYLASILKALISTLSKCDSTEEYNRVLKDSTSVVLSVEDDHGQQMLMQDLIHAVKSQDDGSKLAAVQLLDALIEVRNY